MRTVSNDFLEDSLLIALHGIGITDSTDAMIVFDTNSVSLSLNRVDTISAQIQDTETEIQSAKLFISKGGETTYREFTLNKTDDIIWSTAIPADEITERGIQYYIEAYHGGQGGQGNPKNSHVKGAGLIVIKKEALNAQRDQLEAHHYDHKARHFRWE